jgi:glucokinase
VRRIAVADIGGTHVRFALAQVDGGKVISLGQPVKLQTAEHGSFQLAWQEFGRRPGIDPPAELAIAFAGPVVGEMLKLTNSPWVIQPHLMKDQLGVERLTIVNDFGAVAHAAANLGDQYFVHLCGPRRPLLSEGAITIVGPGTGLGVAALLRKSDGYHIIETEGGHVDFAPLDELEDRILVALRRQFGRVSVERIASGRGLWNVYEALGTIESRPPTFRDEKALWAAVLEGTDSLAKAALDRVCLTLGSVAGDMALAQGASGVVIAGGVGLRLADHLPRSGFGERFVAKGRFEGRMRDIPVKLITHPEPGLYGAAAAFAQEHP